MMIRARCLNDKRRPRSSWWSLWLLLFLAFYYDHQNNQNQRSLLVAPVHAQQQQQQQQSQPHSDGPLFIAQGDKLFDERQYDEAATAFWSAVLVHGQSPPDKAYNVQDVFTKFMQCYIVQDRMADGLAFVSMESFRRGQVDMGKAYLKQALQVDPNNAAAQQIQREYRQLLLGNDNEDTLRQQQQSSSSTLMEKDENNEHVDDLYGKTPEQLYEIASAHFAKKDYEDCADIFEISCMRSGYNLGPSCANAVYCRNMILDWGFNGSQFERDMERTASLVQREARQYRINKTTTSTNSIINTQPGADGNKNFAWQRATSVHPHMMLGYPLADSMLKRYVAESVAYMDELMARAGQNNDNNKGGSSSNNHGNTIIPPLPDDMPYSIDPAQYVAEKEAAALNYRIRVGFVGSGFNSKAVLYLSQDMFRFFDEDRFEIHVFSFGPPDSPLFIQHGMRGVDWRERVKSNVYRFHDMNDMLNLQHQQHIAAARYIHEQGIHILIEWDGYARQGERAQGLFALRPAPIQMLHQEYLGTSGAVYVDYLFTDQVSSPPHLQHLYTEKLVYLPNHFFSKGHAMQTDDVHAPTHEYRPKAKGQPNAAKYELGRGSPVENRCLAPPDVGPATASFVFCNWNKLLKANPETVRSWIRILRQVPDSMLCLLENPKTGTAYLRKFVHEAAGTSSSSSSSSNQDDNDDWESFVPGDGDELNARIHFLPWQRNPFDHQRRNTDFCNIMLDSYPYNGHTVAQDALYAGVPIVTRSDGQDMCSRVTTSANIVLFGDASLDVHLNAYNGTQHYEQLAIAMATNQTLYQMTRKRLIDSCLQRNPMHPYWDVPRYVKNFETGLTVAWQHYLTGQSPDHIVVVESEAASAGTFDEEILAHPVLGNYNKAGYKDDDDKRKRKNAPDEKRQHQGSDEL